MVQRVQRNAHKSMRERGRSAERTLCVTVSSPSPAAALTFLVLASAAKAKPQTAMARIANQLRRPGGAMTGLTLISITSSLVLPSEFRRRLQTPGQQQCRGCGVIVVWWVPGGHAWVWELSIMDPERKARLKALREAAGAAYPQARVEEAPGEVLATAPEDECVPPPRDLGFSIAKRLGRLATHHPAARSPRPLTRAHWESWADTGRDSVKLSYQPVLGLITFGCHPTTVRHHRQIRWTPTAVA